MSEQTKAQRLADILQYKIPSMECLEEAAAELRRLDALNAELVEVLTAILENEAVKEVSNTTHSDYMTLARLALQHSPKQRSRHD